MSKSPTAIRFPGISPLSGIVHGSRNPVSMTPAPSSPAIGPALTNPGSVRLGYVRLGAEDGRDAIHVQLDGVQAQVHGGLSTYEPKDRPKRKTVLIYKGEIGWQITIPILFEGYKQMASQEDAIKRLQRLSLKRKGDLVPPQVIFNAGGAIDHDYAHEPNRRWVITNVDWGAYEVDPQSNPFDRIRQAAVVVLDEAVEDSILHVGLGEKGVHYARYTVLRGDTLKKIAKHKLHDASRWRELARINQVRDGNHLIEGSVLLVPVK